jgi:hypothetical protein
MKNKKLKILYITIGIITCALIIYLLRPPSYSQIMTKAVRKAMGKDFREYHSPSFPTNNFGILTTYENELTDQSLLCAMSGCFESLIINNEKDSINLGGLADVGQGPAIILNERNQYSISVQSLLPELWDILGLGAGVDKKEIVNVALKLGPTYERHLNKIRLNAFINSLSDDNLYKRQYLAGNLVVIVADVVVKNMEITINLEDSAAARLNAKISSKVTLTTDTLKGEFKRLTSGQYSFKINQPLIVLRLARKQPQGSVLGESENFNDWKPVKDNIDRKIKVKPD